MDSPDSMTVFDRRLVRHHRERAAGGWDGFDFLVRETAARLVDRLDDMTRAFPLALDLGCHGGEVGRALGGRGGIRTLIQADLAPAMARRAAARGAGPGLACDEEALPFARGSLDAVLSNLSLHWVNDLPGALIQIRHALKPDGLFLGCLLGGATLRELRTCLADAEQEITGGLSPRTSPLADVRDAGNLLARAGFALPTADSDVITVHYEHPFKLFQDLRGMGESNAVLARRRTPTRRDLILRAAHMYQERHAGPDGRVAATFEVITLTAWAPAPDQPQPLAPGSGQTSLRQTLGGSLDDPQDDPTAVH
ncbi:methyltransferase domain-containing protein [Roseospira goensis]|nr:methyltransferase domain-containing protein [Roseospira goensis]